MELDKQMEELINDKIRLYVDIYMDKLKGSLFKELILLIEGEVVNAKRNGDFNYEEVAKMNPEGTNEDVPLSIEYEHVVMKKHETIEEMSDEEASEEEQTFIKRPTLKRQETFGVMSD